MTELDVMALVRRLEALEAAQRRAVADSTTTSAPSTATSGDAAVAGSVGAFFAPFDVASGDVVAAPDEAWTTVDGVPHGVPAGASFAVVEFRFKISEPDSGDVDGFVYVRSADGGYSYMVAASRAAGDNDNIGGFSQALVPLSPAGTFDFIVMHPGFNNGWWLRLIGYLR